MSKKSNDNENTPQRQFLNVFAKTYQEVLETDPVAVPQLVGQPDDHFGHNIVAAYKANNRTIVVVKGVLNTQDANLPVFATRVLGEKPALLRVLGDARKGITNESDRDQAKRAAKNSLRAVQ